MEEVNENLIKNKKLQNWLQKNRINWAELTPKECEYLIKAVDVYDSQLSNLKREYKEYVTTKYNIDVVCKELGIHRTTAYKKNKSFNNKTILLDFVNDLKKEFEKEKDYMLKEYIHEANFDRNLMNALLKKEKDYIESEETIKELEQEIKGLKAEIESLKKQNENSLLDRIASKYPS